LKDDNGKEFKATPKASHAERSQILINGDSYKGKLATVRYFSLTDEGIPRFPVFIGIRDESDMS
jgi:hypothetical protein